MKQQNGISRAIRVVALTTAIIAVCGVEACSNGKGPATADASSAGLDSGSLKKRIQSIEKDNGKLEVRLGKLVPKDPYVVINTTLNRIYVRKGEDVLSSPDGKRTWYFSTPRGVHKVRNRMERPVWVKPDWAFIEEGEPVPAPNSPDRYEQGVLGSYGLYLGQGYLIHGTLFQRFLGQNVTHGCVRVGDEDLEKVWNLTRIGTAVYIF